MNLCKFPTAEKQKNEEKDATSADCAGRPFFFAFLRMERSDTSQGRGKTLCGCRMATIGFADRLTVCTIGTEGGTA